MAHNAPPPLPSQLSLPGPPNPSPSGPSISLPIPSSPSPSPSQSITLSKLSLPALNVTSKLLHLLFHRNKNQHRTSTWWKHLSILKRNLRRVVEGLGKVQRWEREGGIDGKDGAGGGVAGVKVAAIYGIRRDVGMRGGKGKGNIGKDLGSREKHDGEKGGEKKGGDEDEDEDEDAVEREGRRRVERKRMVVERRKKLVEDVQMRIVFMRERVLGRCYTIFKYVVADLQFAALGLVLVATVARIDAILAEGLPTLDTGELQKKQTTNTLLQDGGGVTMDRGVDVEDDAGEDRRGSEDLGVVVERNDLDGFGLAEVESRILSTGTKNLEDEEEKDRGWDSGNDEDENEDENFDLPVNEKDGHKLLEVVDNETESSIAWHNSKRRKTLKATAPLDDHDEDETLGVISSIGLAQTVQPWTREAKTPIFPLKGEPSMVVKEKTETKRKKKTRKVGKKANAIDDLFSGLT
ncbi:hypothetical protein MMC25_000655 [Agyrium rufum]|nr:hypothetical protein [Agyrium rufum]